MADNTNTTVSTGRNHSGWHAFWGVIGACIALVVAASACVVGYYAYLKYAPLSVQAQVETEYARLHTGNPPTKIVESVPSAQPQVQPNGTSVADGFGADGQLQRTKVVRLNIVDDLKADIADVKDAVKTAADGVKSLGDSIKTLSGNVTDIATQVKDQGAAISDMGSRVTKLETAQAAPAPVQQPAPQTQAPVNPAPAATSQAAPVAGPQASIAAPVQVAGNIVTKHNANEAQLGMMLNAYKDLGAPANGARITGFQELPRGESFTCPDGRPGQLVKSSRDSGGTAARWSCRH